MSVEVDKKGKIKWDKVSPKVKKVFGEILKLSETNPTAALTVISAVAKRSEIKNER